jgi:plasmid maintenance system antidote protein VapI
MLLSGDVMIVDRISEHIKRKGIKQRALAECIDVSPHTISEILAGRRKLTAEEYADICRFLEVPYDRFMS